MNFIIESDRIYCNDTDGNLLAEITFPLIREGVVDVNRTFVSETLRGQGVARKLMAELIVQLKERNLKAVPTCSYVVAWFERNKEEYGDLLA